MDTLDTSLGTARDGTKSLSARLKAVEHLCNVARRSPNENNREKAIDYLQRIADDWWITPEVRERAQDCL